jgi:mRNA-degrading endonuclease RelE of RelBE toxin-antitoxin system
MHALVAAIDALADEPAPPGAFIRSEYRRLRAGSYRVLYQVKDDVITIERVDRA